MRPNVIFINVDQMSALDSIRAMGALHVDTLALDRLLANGRSFTRSFAADPVCCPSRTSWWTGRYPSEHGTALNDTPCHADMREIVLPEQLKKAGVKPYFIGKWHADGLDVREHFHVLHEASWWGELTDTDIATSACAFLDSYDREEPFFLNLGFMNPHDICISPCNDYGRAIEEDNHLTLPYLREGILEDEEIPPQPEAFSYPEPEPHLQWAWNRWARKSQRAEEYDGLTWRMHRYNYHRWVEMVDREIGMVLDALESSRFRENTWIIFTSDHGEGMGRHQIMGKTLFYREVVEVPMVLSSLGSSLPLAKGTSDDRYFVSGVDIAPTVCAIMGADASVYPRGRNLMQLAEGGTPDGWREFAYAESAFSARMVCSEKFKYIRDYRVGEGDYRAPGPETHEVLLEMLFDLEDDPDESRNVADDPRYREALEKMRKAMDYKEGLMEHRTMPGEPGRAWLRSKIQLCKEEGMLA